MFFVINPVQLPLLHFIELSCFLLNPALSALQPKFIHNILKSAERRKLEKERRTERKVQREREEEKGLYNDKECFVTPAYLAKLEELRQAEARERMEALVEGSYFCSIHLHFSQFAYRLLLTLAVCPAPFAALSSLHCGY